MNIRTNFSSSFRLVLLAWFIFTGDAARAAVVSWLDPVSGTWNTPAKWSTGALPGPSDDVVICGGNSYFTYTIARGQPS